MVRSKSIGRAIAVLALGGVLAASFAISPSFSAINKTKVKRIVKNQNAIVSDNVEGTNIDIAGQGGFNLNNPATSLGTLAVPKGVWYFHTDFTVTRNTGGITVFCDFRIGGTVVDTLSSFESDTQSEDTVSMQGTASLPSGGTADVRCDDGAPAGNDTWVDGLDIVAVEGSTLAAT